MTAFQKAVAFGRAINGDGIGDSAKDPEGAITRRFLRIEPFLRILHRREPVFRYVTSKEITRRLRHAFKNAFA
jgi:hypothetical protein